MKYGTTLGILANQSIPWLFVVIAAAGWIGCTGVATPEEKAARQQAHQVTQMYRPQNHTPALPSLDENSPLTNYLYFALLNQPSVEAAYHDWQASIEKITQERSLPDPRLTFQAEIQDVLMSLMPGLMMDIPGPGKRSAQARVASAESQSRYHLYEAALLQTAYGLKQAYYNLQLLEDKLRINQHNLALLGEIENMARARHGVGQATLQDVLRAQMEQDQATSEIASLQDSGASLRAQFKAALGLRPDQPDPPLPNRFDTTTMDLPDQLLTEALQHNPRIKSMESDVLRAEAAIRLASKSRLPDFSLGLEANVQAYPIIYAPQASATLPIWRDKIAAQIAEAQALKRAAEARLTAEQISLAVDVAEKLFMYREATRNLALIRERLIPKARQALDAARAAYLSNQVAFTDLIEAERALLDFQLKEADAVTRRELSLAQLSLLIARRLPERAPVASHNPTSLSSH